MNVFAETPHFQRQVQTHFRSDEDYARLQAFLNEAPESGVVIRGSGGMRKLRWEDERRGKGRRGGLRVIYLHVPEHRRILMLHVFSKDESDDLNAEDRRVLTALAEEYRRSLRERSRG